MVNTSGIIPTDLADRWVAPGVVQRRLLIFQLPEHAFAIPLETVREIISMAALSRPPGLPSIVAGFLNLGGTAVGVLRLDRLLCMSHLKLSLYTPLILLRSAGLQLALMVEKVTGIVSVDGGAILPVGEHRSFNNCAVGVLILDQILVTLLSPNRILMDQEQRALAEFEAMERARLIALENDGS